MKRLMKSAIALSAALAGLGLVALAAFGEADQEQKPSAPKVAHQLRFHAKTGSLPKGVVLAPDQSAAWVTNFGHDRGHNITVFDPATGEVKKRISFKGRAVELAFSPDGATAYVSNFDSGRLMFINARTYQLEGSVKVGSNPKIVTLSPDGGTIYVSNWASNTVSVVDVGTRQVTATVKAGKNPRGSDTDASGRYLFVANFNGHTLSVVDLEAMKQVQVLKMRAHPRHVTATPDGRFLLVSNMGRASNELAVVDPETFEVVNWIKVGGGPKVIAVSPDSRFAFTADYTGHSVSIVDLAAMKKIGQIKKLGKASCGLDLSKDGRLLLVTSWYSNDLWAFDLSYAPE